ncbi:4-(cytidine 5'-diphospho)-2-C-methyl-D-erythritol kinase [Acetobacteraceae bacterium ESL0709]|nr:4-(cytidine 5'-diphospho)-2-C-methyl-D-erythritol kinase [Acetobacteraceae bacterium ESL0697]MDF7678734.1 4-(cytidine 5'-diphospho)-2-C-methyl-D-erythritol kinase [Acetobacteraceae bacterium ESL0709]
MLQDTAPAKINLYLHITGRREDGYHLLDSLAVFAGAGDRLSLIRHDKPDITETATLTLTGPFSEGLKMEPDNLVLRAAHFLKQKALDVTKCSLPPVAFTLEKNLPVSSGIGGGSADAACALRLLTRYWELPLSLASEIAPFLGADVPVCLNTFAQRMENIGDHLSPAPRIPSLGMILVNPGVAVSTPVIFKDLNLPKGVSAPTTTQLPAHGWENAKAFAAFLETTRNDLQPPAIRQVPVIKDVLHALSALPEVLFARMSGSGATCFALFETAEKAFLARETLMKQQESKGWWCWAGDVLP